MHDERLGMGKSIVINGELSASEDLTVEGCVEGKIQLSDHVLTVGSNARIKAQVTAKAIVVLGQVTGNLIATEKVDIKESGSVEGDIVAPRVAIADGSHFRGSIDMQKKDQPTTADQTIGGFEAESKTGKPDTQKPEPSSVNGELVRV
jgi:cytoskeletal protein CcmA (bactofilin family)